MPVYPHQPHLPPAFSSGLPGRDAHYVSLLFSPDPPDRCYMGGDSRTRVEGPPHTNCGLHGTGSRHRLNLGHAHEQEGGYWRHGSPFVPYDLVATVNNPFGDDGKR